MIIIILLLYSAGITYHHVKGEMIEKKTQDIIEKQLKEHDIEPSDYNFGI